MFVIIVIDLALWRVFHSLTLCVVIAAIAGVAVLLVPIDLNPDADEGHGTHW